VGLWPKSFSLTYTLLSLRCFLHGSLEIEEYLVVPKMSLNGTYPVFIMSEKRWTKHRLFVPNHIQLLRAHKTAFTSFTIKKINYQYAVLLNWSVKPSFTPILLFWSFFAGYCVFWSVSVLREIRVFFLRYLNRTRPDLTHDLCWNKTQILYLKYALTWSHFHRFSLSFSVATLGWASVHSWNQRDFVL
jgi:hypothetical protein